MPEIIVVKSNTEFLKLNFLRHKSYFKKKKRIQRIIYLESVKKVDDKEF